MNNEITYIRQQISKLGIEIDERQAEQFYQYYSLLTEWNQFMNLTAITDFQEVVEKHFVDSLSIVFVQDIQRTETMIDVGTGGGFPGIPLKIAFSHLKVTLLDSLQKRITFLDHVIGELGLTDMKTIHGRAEDFAKPGLEREKYDLCVSRAVANLSTLSEYCLPFVKTGGSFVSYKSKDAKQELQNAKNAIFLLGGKTEECKDFILPETDISRSLVKIKKVNGCPKKYPRKSGTASRSPL
ncbi:MAG: 16S rRNA (guanine(527)-N(7))-methyltransferase RsmG [Lachnospiraceae bacterium]|nr:16S rRNA (guanine(527)-N(7))-methyltransferase RsmG [Lachnospiraceae bacterium]